MLLITLSHHGFPFCTIHGEHPDMATAYAQFAQLNGYAIEMEWI